MKRKTCLILLLSVTQLSIAPAFGKGKDDGHEKILAKERARIAQASIEINSKKAELVQLDGEIKQVRALLAKAKRSTAIYTGIFLSSSFVTSISLLVLGKGLNAKSRMGTKTLSLYLGIPMTAIGTAVTGASGVMHVFKSGEADEFDVKLAGLEAKVDRKLEAIKKAEKQLNEAKTKLCLLGEHRPADCENVDEYKMKVD